MEGSASQGRRKTLSADWGTSNRCKCIDPVSVLCSGQRASTSLGPVLCLGHCCCHRATVGLLLLSLGHMFFQGDCPSDLLLCLLRLSQVSTMASLHQRVSPLAWRRTFLSQSAHAEPGAFSMLHVGQRVNLPHGPRPPSVAPQSCVMLDHVYPYLTHENAEPSRV